MNCPNCSTEVADHLRSCDSCGNDCGFPNVRLAEKQDEVDALNKRLSDAETSSDARNCLVQLQEFGAAVKSSRAVISRPLAVIDNIVSEGSLYVSFQKQVEMGTKQPLDNEYDRVRGQYETALFPHFSKEIVFASLTLTEHGLTGYGPYCMVLADKMIAIRSTVFEENPHVFVEKHRIIMNQPIPAGYRATWTNRDALAKAKLVGSIDEETKPSDHGAILAKDTGETGGGDWIEVHIYGSINRNAIETLTGPEPKTREDKIIWKSLQAKFNQ